MTILARKLLAVMLLAGATSALAQPAFPVKPLRMIVPFPPGGGNDLLARAVGQRLSEVVSQQVIVDNRGGAGGALGAHIAATAAPDGYTLFLGSLGNLAQNPLLQEKPIYDPVRDFAAVTLLATSVFVLVVNNSVPVKTVPELIALAKAKPGMLNYGSAGVGSSVHLAPEIFKHSTGTNIVHVAYKGAGAAFIDLIAGQVQMMLTTLPAGLPHVRAGKVRALGTSGKKRVAVLADVPTIAETVQGFEILNWQGVTVPVKTPAAIVNVLHGKLAASLKMPGMNEALHVQGFDADGQGPAEFGALIKSEIARYGKVVKAVGIRVDLRSNQERQNVSETNNEALIVVPDDFPAVFEGSAAHDQARALGGVRVCGERGAEDSAELARRIGGARVAVNIRAYAHFTDAVFAACPNLKMVSIWGVGTDNIDLEAAKRHGVTVCNTPGANAIAVAEHAIALMMAVARKIPQIDSAMRRGDWPRDMLGQLHGKTLALLGTGAIGSHVGKLARAFGMNVLAWSARRHSMAERDDMLKRADFVSLHVRLTPQTRGFIGTREFGLMKPEAILVNTGRGALVDRDALHDALAKQRIAGAGLDVFHDEPLKAGDPILGFANTVLSPHNAGQTPEVRRDGLLLTIQNVEKFLAGAPQNVVV